jgi:FMN phosphatase YigB (HAD superfamily)
MHKKTTHIIFDFGNVLLLLNDGAVKKCLKETLGISYDIYHEHLPFVFEAYEKGELSTVAFLEGLSEIYEATIDPVGFSLCWNSLLSGIPEYHIQLLKALKSSYRLVLLSNTNDLHIQWVEAYLSRHYPDFWSYFSHVFLSYQIGMRKPDSNIFLHVLKTLEVTPESCLFIDDGPMHVEGAKKVGIPSILHPVGADLKHTLNQGGIVI